MIVTILDTQKCGFNAIKIDRKLTNLFDRLKCDKF